MPTLCASCGTDSVATCAECGRRICNRHMVISASRDHSLAGPFHVSGLSPVRLVHPTGESHVNQPNGAFLRGYTAGGPRCHECRQADGQAAMPRQADTATLGSLDRNASIAVRHFLQRVRGLPGQEIVVSRQRKPPLRFGRHRRWLATPDPWVFLGNSGEFDFRVIQAQVIFSAKDFSSSDPPAITERRVWISMSEDPIVAIDIRYGQRYEHLKPISYSRHSETIGPVGNRLSVREGYELCSDALVRTDLSTALPFYVGNRGPWPGLPETQDEIEATGAWLHQALDAYPSAT
jgi:hypothetical protein